MIRTHMTPRPALKTTDTATSRADWPFTGGTTTPIIVSDGKDHPCVHQHLTAGGGSGADGQSRRVRGSGCHGLASLRVPTSLGMMHATCQSVRISLATQITGIERLAHSAGWASRPPLDCWGKILVEWGIPRNSSCHRWGKSPAWAARSWHASGMAKHGETGRPRVGFVLMDSIGACV